ncbi:MAG: YncE family protein [Candidatus Kryptoniota bacterium]
MKRKSITLFLAVLIASCAKTPTGPSGQSPLPSASLVYVVNEGNFGKGNSSLTAFYPDSNKTIADIFKTVNGRNLGDTGNDIAIYNGRAYIVVNNSDKIEIIDAHTALSIKTIYYASGTSPYRIAIDQNDGKGFVTDLYKGRVSVINLATNSLSSDSITVGQNPYGIIYTNGKVFVANSGFGSGNTVSVIDAATEKTIKTIKVGYNPTNLIDDGNGHVWVVCTGNWNPDTPGYLFVIDRSSLAVADSLYIGGHPGKIAADPQRNSAYLIGDSAVIKLDLKARQITSANFVIGSFYGIAVDEATGNIYFTNPKDYVTNGTVSIYSPSGSSTGISFTAGIIPDAIAFER